MSCVRAVPLVSGLYHSCTNMSVYQYEMTSACALVNARALSLSLSLSLCACAQFFEHAEHIFNACDFEGKGVVDQEIFFSIIRQMNHSTTDIQHETGVCLCERERYI